MTDAAFAFGTRLFSGGVGGTDICEITNISGVELTSDEIDITHHKSPSGFREFIQGLRDGGTISIEGNFVPGDAGQALLLADFLTGEVKTYAIVFPDAVAATWEFTAFVMSAPSTEAPVDGKVPFTAELRITGVPSLDVTTSGGLTALTGTEETAVAALTFVPAFSNATLEYNVTVDTASTFIKLTPTAASHTIVITALGVSETVATGVESGEIAIGAADTVTEVTIDTKEVGKVRKIYKLNVARP